MRTLSGKEVSSCGSIIPFSGGIDSSYLLAIMPGALGLAIDDGSDMCREVELPSIRKISLALDKPVVLMSFPETDLLEFPRHSDGLIGLLAGYKVMLQILAMSLAHRLGAQTVVFGNNLENTQYRDESIESVRKTEKLYNDIYDTEIHVTVPFDRLEKWQVIKAASELPGFPMQLTQGCSDPPSKVNPWKHCGICISCIERKTAFKAAGVVDPTEYSTQT